MKIDCIFYKKILDYECCDKKGHLLMDKCRDDVCKDCGSYYKDMIEYTRFLKKELLKKKGEKK